MDRVKGFDCSHWNDDKSTPQKIDFNKAVAKGAKFVFIKVSERGSIDRDYEYNWESAKAAGLLRGGYHYLRWNLDGKKQAQIFCAVLANDPGELPPVADFEAPGSVSLKVLEDFLWEVERILGKRPIIYTSPGFWLKNGNTHGKWLNWDLWEAHYTSAAEPMPVRPWIKDWTFWQWTSKGDGLAHGAESKDLDLNWFNGNITELRVYADMIPEQPDPPEPGPELEKRVLKVENWIQSFKG